MSARNKFRPYVRLANGKEKTQSIRVAYRLAFYQTLGRPFYVMVQRGFPRLVMDCGKSKRDLKQSVLVVFSKRKSFKQWASDMKKHATGGTA